MDYRGLKGQAGLTSYQAPPVDLSNLRRDVVFFWALRTGALMRAYIRDPAGHDYPKVNIPSVENHRVAMVLDTLKSWGPLAKTAAQLYFGDEVADQNVAATFWSLGGNTEAPLLGLTP